MDDGLSRETDDGGEREMEDSAREAEAGAYHTTGPIGSLLLGAFLESIHYLVRQDLSGTP